MKRIVFHAPMTITLSRLVSNSGYVMRSEEGSLRN